MIVSVPLEATWEAEESAAAAALRKPIRDDCLTLGLGPGEEEGVAVASGLTEEEGRAGGLVVLLGR